MGRLANINNDLCIGCGQCIKDCPQSCFKAENGKPVFIGTTCIGCAHCACICPVGAVTLDGETIEDYREVRRDAIIDPGDLQAFMETRRSIRHFTDEPVSREDIEKLLEAGRYAPSAVNAQAIRYTVILDEMDKFTELVWEGYRMLIDQTRPNDPARADHLYRRISALEADPKDDQMIFGAKAAILVSVKKSLDTGIAASYIELMAHSLGLGALYSGYCLYSISINKKLADWLDLKDYEPVDCLLIGHPAVKYKRIPKRKPADVVYK